jgi:hypothetical protein
MISTFAHYRVASAGTGVVIHLRRSDGRTGCPTIGGPDCRAIGHILRDLGIDYVEVLTDVREGLAELEPFGITIGDQLPLGASGEPARLSVVC